MGGAIAAAKKLGVGLKPGFYAAATPSGTLGDATAEKLMEEVVASVSPDSDGLLLIVHGAMVAASYPDLEGGTAAPASREARPGLPDCRDDRPSRQRQRRYGGTGRRHRRL
ncbi:M81 family metallopeptidase [Cohnella rhizosphaerae]|uniref:M81 family metallopeptidase n=1 Tax=Cohnella rhizosphaerae TaxID=1457232 RepID=A0A9X4KY08_9BACL|nr:M81 family metallopeptidase [Cohnella rhizosphaerae]MDG0813396.1 M81 family metallopeptidase [Cohnella rhizosphaerae]